MSTDKSLFLSDFSLASSCHEETRDELECRLHSVDEKRKELLEQLAELDKEISEINSCLTSFETIRISPIELGEPTIKKDGFTLEEKAAFYLSLFSGRRDVYARRYRNNSSGKMSYSPYCKNFWKEGCLKIPSNIKGNRVSTSCNDCTVRDYGELTAEVVVNKHLSCRDPDGYGAIGFYMMKPGNVCTVAAIDLDEASWENDATAIIAVAREHGFPMAIERSFSGNGAHLWLFFSEDIPAKKVRQLCLSLMDEASCRYRSISMKSYDRIFPSQDTVSRDGLGNLILMPLVRSAAIRGCTVFLDDKFEMIDDQTAYLSSLPKVSSLMVDYYLDSVNMLDIPEAGLSSDDIEPLWKRRLPVISKNDLKKDLILYYSSGITIDKTAISKKFLLFLRRFSSFSNPEYYKLLSKHNGYVSKNIPSSITSFVENDQVFWIPRGLGESLEAFLNMAGIPFRIENHRVSSPDLKIEFKYVLRSDQITPFRKMADSKFGILKAATSFGKTVIAAALIAEHKEHALVLVNSRQLLMQWKERLEAAIEIVTPVPDCFTKRSNKNGIGIIGAQKNYPTTLVDVAMLQTISSMIENERPSFLDSYGLVIVDECHHIAAETYEPVLRNLRPSYVYGLSATEKRKDGLEKLVYAQCGPVLYEVSAAALAEKRNIKQYLVPRFTTSKVQQYRFNHVEALGLLIADEKRNELIVIDIEEAYRKKRKILVLSDRVEHIDILSVMLTKKDVPVLEYTGRATTAEQREIRKCIDADIDGRYVILASSRFAGEGTDIAHLDTLFLVTPASWEGRITQFAGRIARASKGKCNTYIYDYADIAIPVYERMYRGRLKTYKGLGYLVAGSNEIEPEGCLYYESDFLKPLIEAIRRAKSSIVISSPILNPSYRTRQIIKSLAELSDSIKITIKAEPCNEQKYKDASDEAQRLISESGLTLTFIDQLPLCFLVVDNEEIWYSELSFLGLAKNIDLDKARTILHFHDQKMAMQLIEADLQLVL